MKICLPLVFLHSLATQAAPLTLQLITKRFQWPLARAGYLLTVKAIVSVFTLLVISPATEYWLGLRDDRGRLLVHVGTLQASFLVLALGNSAIGLSYNVAMVVAGQWNDIQLQRAFFST